MQRPVNEPPVNKIIEEIRKGQRRLALESETFVGRGLNDDDVKNIVEALIAREQVADKKYEEMTLDLSSNNITYAAITHLVEMLSKNQVNIVRLNLSKNDLNGGNVPGSGMIYLALALDGNTTVKALFIDNIQIGLTGMDRLGMLLFNNRSLEWLSCKDNKNTLRHSSEVTGRLIAGLRNNTSLKNVNFQNTLHPNDEQKLVDEINRKEEKAKKNVAATTAQQAEEPSDESTEESTKESVEVVLDTNYHQKTLKGFFKEVTNRHIQKNTDDAFEFIREKLVSYSKSSIKIDSISNFITQRFFSRHHADIIKALLNKPEYQSFNKDSLSKFFTELNTKLQGTEINPQGELYAIIETSEALTGIKIQTALQNVSLRNSNSH